MLELVTSYQTKIEGDDKFFKSLTFFTSKYDNERNYAAFYPRNIDIDTNKIFANTILNGLSAEVVTFSDYSEPVPWPYPGRRPQFTRQISVPGEHVRTAIQRLFERREIGSFDRKIMEEPLKKLESSLNFTSKVSPHITSEQRECIENFITPYLQVLKEKMRLWEIREASKKAYIIVNGYLDPERSLKSVLPNMVINQYPLMGTSDTNPNVPVINKQWSAEEQDEILDSLFMMGRVLSGKANLEGMLLQTAETVPNLQTQKQVVMELIVSHS